MCPDPSERDPAWDQNSIVTPRAFLSEYGYDLAGEQLPTSLGKFLIRSEYCEPVRTYIRTFESSAERKTQGRFDGPGHGAESLVTTSRHPSQPASTSKQGSVEPIRPPGTPTIDDAQNAIQTYRLLDEAETDVGVDRHGGVLVRYQYPRSAQYMSATDHQPVGFYWIGLQTAHELEHKLTNGPNEGPWSNVDEASTEKRRLPTPDELVGQNREWATKPNPAAHESWVVISEVGSIDLNHES